MTDLPLSRRTLLKVGAAMGIGAGLSTASTPVAAQTPLDLTKWQTTLPLPGVKSPEKRQGADFYPFTIERTSQQLHPDLPNETPLWGYDGSYPGPTIEARQYRRVKVEFDNEPLYDGGNRDHLLSVDDRVHGTKPEDYDGFDGPVPEIRTTTHCHGLHVESASDGLPESWKAPDGTWGPRRKKDILDYSNRQSPAMMFYHDHALGITRLNVYAGLAGFYMLRGKREDNLDLPRGDLAATTTTERFEIPCLIQDRTFNEDGSLFYPPGDNAAYEAEFSGDTVLVNGKVWPYVEVLPRRYRFRFLNGSNGRTYNLSLKNQTASDEDDVPTMYQTGVDLGFLPEVVTIGPESDDDLASLTLAGAERGDVIVDFDGYEGETFNVFNDAEFPYVGENSGVGTGEFAKMDEVLQIQVQDVDDVTDESADPTTLSLPANPGFPEASTVNTRQMFLNSRAVDGLDTHFINDSFWTDESAIVEPQAGTTEVWEIFNDTPDTHPIHLHLVEYDVLERIKHAPNDENTHEPGDIIDRVAPDPNETVNKDTVRINPDETVRLISRFGEFTGRYVWHCHILEHEDQEMMLPYNVRTRKNDR